MNFIIVPIQPEYAKEEVYQQLTDLARSLGMKPNKYVAGTEDEKYSLITEMLSAIIRKELQVVHPTPHALDGAGTSPEYGATSNCIVCMKRIVFCGDGVWLHCEPQVHGHARPNGAIVNPPRQ